MKELFSKHNVTTFVVAALAASAAILFIVPLARKFVPGLQKTTTTATAPTGT